MLPQSLPGAFIPHLRAFPDTQSNRMGLLTSFSHSGLFANLLSSLFTCQEAGSCRCLTSPLAQPGSCLPVLGWPKEQPVPLPVKLQGERSLSLCATSLFLYCTSGPLSFWEVAMNAWEAGGDCTHPELSWVILSCHLSFQSGSVVLFYLLG